MRRLTIVLATVAAFFVVSVAQAAAQEFKQNITGNGSGEVSSAGGIGAYGGEFEAFGSAWQGEPPIECSYASPGPATGVCKDEVPIEEGIQGLALRAIAKPGSEFAGWKLKNVGNEPFGPEVDCNSAPNCFILLSPGPEREATAVFCTTGTAQGWGEPCAEATPNIKLNVEEGEGTVVSNPAGLECTKAAPGFCEAALPEGKVVLTASPAPGYLVKGWKGCDTGGVNGRQCTVTATGTLKNVGVKFYKVFSLAGSKSGGSGIMSTTPGGINCGYACSSSTALYKEGGLTVKAKPAKHFEFVEFKGGTGSASSCNGVKALECTIASFNSNSTIEEVYAAEAQNTLTYKAEGGGQGFIKTTPANINCGYTCTAAAAQFYASESAAVAVTLGKGTSSLTWTTSAGTCTGKVLTCSVPMSSSKSLVAKFE